LNPSDKLENLRAGLASMPSGKLPAQDEHRITSDLAQCWDELAGSNDGGMTGSKFFDRKGPRTEGLQWNPPVLKFQIERHGGRVLSSTRGELQTWEINAIKAMARIVATSHRQLEPMAARLDVNPLASETAKMIVDGRESPWLKWMTPTRVRVVSGEVIPATNKQTTAGRRKRFGAALEQLLGPQGWRRNRSGSQLVFERTTEG
jgi:hypothetical protein